MSRKTKRILAIVGAVLAVVMLVAVLGKATGSFENLFHPDEWELRKPNEDNMFQHATFAGGEDGKIASGENGVTVTLSDDNEIKISGTAESDMTVDIASLPLTSGVSYVFDSGLNDGSKGTMYLEIVNGDSTVAACYSAPVVFEGVAATCTVRLHIAKDCVTNVTLRPVICQGAEAEDLINFWS